MGRRLHTHTRTHTPVFLVGLPAPRESNTPSLLPPPSPSPSPQPADPPTHPEGEADVGAIVGSLMAVLIVLSIGAAAVIVVMVLLRYKQQGLCKTTKPPPIDNPNYQGKHGTAFSSCTVARARFNPLLIRMRLQTYMYMFKLFSL